MIGTLSIDRVWDEERAIGFDDDLTFLKMGGNRADVRPRFFAIRADEKSALAIQRFTEECRRLLNVMESRLEESAYLAGDDYTIADIICYPWTLAGTTYLKPVLGPIIEAAPSVNCWLTTVGEREAVKRGMAAPKVWGRILTWV